MTKREKIQQAFTFVLLGATPEAVIPIFLNSLTVKEQREFEMFMSLSDDDKKAVLKNYSFNIALQFNRITRVQISTSPAILQSKC